MSIVEVISPDYIKVMSGVGLGIVGTLAVTWVRQVDIAHAQQRITAFLREEDEQDAAFLAQHRARFALPAAPSADPHVTGELVGVESAPEPPCCDGHMSSECNGYGELSEACCEQCPDWDWTPQPNPLRARALSDRPAEDEDEVGDEQPGEAWPWWTPLAMTAAVLAVAVLLPFWVLWLAGEWAVGKVLAFVEYLDDRFKTDAARAREWEQVEGGPWSWEDEQRAQGGADPFERFRIDDSPRGRTDEQIRAEIAELTGEVNPPYKPRHWNDMTAQYEVVKPGRHCAEPEMPAINVPAQRTGDADA